MDRDRLSECKPSEVTVLLLEQHSVVVKVRNGNYHFRAQDADCFFLITDAKSSSRKCLLCVKVRDQQIIRVF